MVRAASGRMGSSRTIAPSRLAVDPYEHGEGPVEVGPPAHGVGPGWRGTREDPVRVADLDHLALDLPGDALTRALVDIRGQRERQVAASGRPDHGPGEHVW